uniref:Endonuclease n=1 Tax=Sinocyclocheilus anshuiensis TaxID=1608454 RepID=A0A671N569_9TELE
WGLSGLSVTAGIGIGATLTAACDRFNKNRDTSHSGGLLDLRLPFPSLPFPSLSNIKSRESYVTSYDPRNRTAAWVIEQLNAETVTGTSDRKFCDFKEDDSVHVYHRSSNADYKGSGFDRGHLAAAANHKWSQKAMDDTFYLSNVSRQNPHLNQNAWINLEKYCSLLKSNVKSGQEPDGKMYVKYQVLGKNHVAVPTHFLKVVILEKPRGDMELRSYVMPNMPVDEKIPLERFLVPIESIERASGLLFVPNIMKRTSNLKAITAGP